MSTTFQVYPKTTYIPSFQELTEAATLRLRDFLHEFNIPGSPMIGVELHKKQPDSVQPLQLTSPTIWPDDSYAWFQVAPVLGGTDAYFWHLDEEDREIWQEEMDSNERLRSRWGLVESCLANGYYWNFRRSIGQPAIINVAYGLIAATLAELTEGFVWSDDSAWDYERFPATAGEFFAWYFRPSLALDPGHRDWAERCMAALAEELQA